MKNYKNREASLSDQENFYPNCERLGSKFAEKDLPSSWNENRNRAAGTRQTLPIAGTEYGFCWAPAGTFTMGSPEDEEGRQDDETQREVTLTRGFWILETPVTQGLWESVAGENPSSFSKNGERSSEVSGVDASILPVEHVSWNDCQNFIEKLNIDGFSPPETKFATPTEAQWEYVCRAGTTGAYNGNGGVDALGWYDDVGGEQPRAVKMKKPNAWGVYDMHGNVCEWCADWLGKYPIGAATDPIGPPSGSLRVLRGGCWIGVVESCRSASRDGDGPTARTGCYGFRLVLLPRE